MYPYRLGLPGGLLYDCKNNKGWPPNVPFGCKYTMYSYGRRSLIESFESDGPPSCRDDLDFTEVAVFIGRTSNETNTFFCERALVPAGERDKDK
ncbi:hypothetical protein [Neobacillus terrae]|uniref:hypothetical protein n=1 Tax=Neobacillus terrae TaxID=3034837 RepID=UPI001409922F|nr:hypothetical protein [Neobacillus terrae]NHM33907.1 hypothetical protein [Neobacillus terrae]